MGMTQTKNSDFTVDQIVTITPLHIRQYVVVAIDDLSEDMIYVDPVDGNTPAQWVFTTYVKPVAEQEDATE